MILELKDVNAFYGKGQVLFKLSLQVAEGGAVAVLGRNGVGKSTMMKTIMGIMNARNKASMDGSILYHDIQLANLPTFKIAKTGIGYVPQGRRIFSNLTTKENLLLAERKGNDQAWDLDRIYQLFPVLKERSSVMGNRLSGGEQQMLAIARGLMQNPDLLLLDEISEGLAPIVVNELSKVIQKLTENGVSILLAEQNARFALSCCKICYIMEKGTIIHSSDTATITSDILQKYLGA